MIIINTHEAKTRLSYLLKQVEEKGECVRICRNGTPVAELRPARVKANPLMLDPSLKVRFLADPMEPLDPEDWPELED